MPFVEITLPSGDTTQMWFDEETEQVKVTISLMGTHEPGVLKQFKAKAMANPLPGCQFAETDPREEDADISWRFVPCAGVHMIPVACLPRNEETQRLLVALLPDLLTSDEVWAKDRAFPIEPKYCFVQFTAEKQRIVLWDVEIPAEAVDVCSLSRMTCDSRRGTAAGVALKSPRRLSGIAPKENPDIQAHHRERMQKNPSNESALLCPPERLLDGVALDTKKGAECQPSVKSLRTMAMTAASCARSGDLYMLGVSVLLMYAPADKLIDFFLAGQSDGMMNLLDGILNATQKRKWEFLDTLGLIPDLRAFVAAAWHRDPVERKVKVLSWVRSEVQSEERLINAVLEKKKIDNTKQFEKTRLPETALRKAGTQSKGRQTDPDVMPGHHRRTYSM